MVKTLESLDMALARASGEIVPIPEAEIANMSATRIVLAVMKRQAGEKLYIKEIFRSTKELGYKKLNEHSTAMVLSRLYRKGIIQREGKGIYLYNSPSAQ